MRHRLSTGYGATMAQTILIIKDAAGDPVADLRQRTYGKGSSVPNARADHYASELVLLYVITLAGHELAHFIDPLEGIDYVDVGELEPMRQAIRNGHAAARHFWFLGSGCHRYDEWRAMNQRAFRAHRDGAAQPAQDEPLAVPYPRDPLARIVALHLTTSEWVTSLAYISPWPRADAQVSVNAQGAAQQQSVTRSTREPPAQPGGACG